jgi:hypothetical protein
LLPVPNDINKVKHVAIISVGQYDEIMKEPKIPPKLDPSRADRFAWQSPDDVVWLPAEPAKPFPFSMAAMTEKRPEPRGRPAARQRRRTK